MTSGVSTQTWIIQVCSKCILPNPAKCLMCMKILTDPCRTSPLSIKLIVSDKLLGARNLWSVKLQLDIPNPAQTMRPCASVLCLGPGSRSYKCKVSPTRLCMPTQVGTQAHRGLAHCRAALVRVFLGGTSFLCQNLCWKHRLWLFVYSLEASKAASQSWRSTGKWPASQGHICLMLQGHHCPRCSALQGLSCRSSYLSKVSGYSCYPKLMHV